ncbi:MAG TPA: NUDIX hydrolase [Anaerolineales bacterium]|nr:NUDIX hydrolase [Anaerolineales bacterium]
MKISAGALIFYQNNLLILKPSYRDYWLLPGGGLLEGESPRDACIREIREEISLHVTLAQLLCIDFLPIGLTITGLNSTRTLKNEELTFLFLAESLTNLQKTQLCVDGKEIVSHQFVSLDEAKSHFPSYMVKRLPHCLNAIKDQTTYYLENGEPTYPLITPRQSG